MTSSDFFNKLSRTSSVWPAGLKPPSAAAVGGFLTRPPSVAAVNSTSFSPSVVGGCQRKPVAKAPPERALFAQLAFHDSPAAQHKFQGRDRTWEAEVKEGMCSCDGGRIKNLSALLDCHVDELQTGPVRLSTTGMDEESCTVLC